MTENAAHDWLVGSAPLAYANPRIGYAGALNAAMLVRTETVEGIAVPLYANPASSGQLWPTLPAVREMLGGMSYSYIEHGAGWCRVGGAAGLVEIVSPPAVAMAIRRSLHDGHITPDRAKAILVAIGET